MGLHKPLLALALMAVVISTISAKELPGNFTLGGLGSSNVCFAGEFKLALEVKYPTPGQPGKFNTTTIPLDNTTYRSYDGFCNQTSPTTNGTQHVLRIFMVPFGGNNIQLTFSINDKKTTTLSHLEATVILPAVAGVHFFKKDVSMFETDQGNSYRCNSKSTTDLGNEAKGKGSSATLILQNLRIQPFVNETQPFNGYGVEKVCTTDMIKNPSNLIPIIVGVCLAVLVIIVLVAYLIGRRRNRNGYQSV